MKAKKLAWAAVVAVVILGWTAPLHAASQKIPNGNKNASLNTVQLQPVPEPGTWAMLVGGLGMLIGVQRMRRRIQ